VDLTTIGSAWQPLPTRPPAQQHWRRNYLRVVPEEVSEAMRFEHRWRLLVAIRAANGDDRSLVKVRKRREHHL
jgi:hypothetical protein